MNEPDGTVNCPYPLSPQHTTDPSGAYPTRMICSPVETWVNEPDGAVASPEPVVAPADHRPSGTVSHTNAYAPAETWVNEPSGTITCPYPLSPQHTTEPPVPQPTRMLCSRRRPG